MLGGMLDRFGEQSGTFAAISEFPDRLQLTTQSGIQARTIIYDGQTARVIGGSLTNADQGLIESVVNDTAEHFFLTQMQGAPTRHLGNRFRADDGSATNYAGPFQDVFSMLDKFKWGTEIRSGNKVYYFNSDSHLLEKVTYRISRNGEPVEVETRFSAWDSVEGQQVPRGVARLENGQQVMSLTITSVAVGPRLNDFFSQRRARVYAARPNTQENDSCGISLQIRSQDFCLRSDFICAKQFLRSG